MNFLKKTIILAFCALPLFLSAQEKILAFAGSTRADSYNKKLVREAADIARELGAQVTIIDLKDYPMPFYDADLEAKEGLPPNAKKLRDLMIKSDGMIIATPEYNRSVSAVLKNTLDWVSRGEDGRSSHDSFKGKKVAIMSASPGRGGGARALAHLRPIIEDIGGEVVSKQVAVPNAHTQFNENGRLQNDEIKKELRAEIQQLLSK